MPTLKILLFASNPSGTDRLKLDEEVRAIITRVRATPGGGAIDVIASWATRPDDLLDELNRYMPTIVHFSGHGTTKGEIILVDDSGQVRPVAADVLRELFACVKDNIRVVFLNACYSEIQAKAIAEVIDVVVGMRTEIGDEAAVRFAAAFYSALGFGRSVKNAFRQGLISLRANDIGEEQTPQLLARPTADPDTIVLAQSQGPSRRRVKGTEGKANVVVSAAKYFTERVQQTEDFHNDPVLERLEEIGDCEHISDLRLKLLRRGGLKDPKEMTVKGILYPAALLTSGWWEKVRARQKDAPIVTWKDEVQAWLFNGFDLWAPSWDFTWGTEAWVASTRRRFGIAQIGGGDEADSLPVFIPLSKIPKVNVLLQEHAGVMEVEIKAVLASRKVFCAQTCSNRGEKCQACRKLKMFGGLLDYCLWIDENNSDHGIKGCRKADFYSGYLWKCVAPREWVAKSKSLILDDLIFIWEHTNFASPDAVKYNLEFLAQKEAFFKAKYGDLIYVHKSSPLVPGTPEWSSQEVFDLLSGTKPTLA